MSPVQIVGGAVLTPRGFEQQSITLKGDTIAAVGENDRDVPTVVDATGLIVAPGFVDIQINGAFGQDFVSDPASIWGVGSRLVEHGVTSFLPTIITSPREASQAALSALRARPVGYAGAEPLGLHIEGPMLSRARPGTHPVEHLVLPDASVIDGWSRAAGVAMVTIAPELPGASEVIADLAALGVVIAAGHTNADAAQTLAAKALGVRAVTHLFNAMAPFKHREPNLAGVALTDPELIAGLIVDGIHVDPVAVALAWSAKGPSGIALVTDAVAAMGEPDGNHQLGGQGIHAGTTGVRNSRGDLAGSNLTMDRAVRNLVEYTGCEPADALRSASETPARLLNEPRLGSIIPGATADLVVLDRDLHVQITVRAGVLLHIEPSARDRVAPQLKEGR